MTKKYKNRALLLLKSINNQSMIESLLSEETKNQSERKTLIRRIASHCFLGQIFSRSSYQLDKR